ncbi:hypothetical protein Droror1_Dr00019535 [Drosera rotundifolia]
MRPVDHHRGHQCRPATISSGKVRKAAAGDGYGGQSPSLARCGGEGEMGLLRRLISSPQRRLHFEHSSSEAVAVCLDLLAEAEMGRLVSLNPNLWVVRRTEKDAVVMKTMEATTMAEKEQQRWRRRSNGEERVDWWSCLREGKRAATVEFCES